MKNQKQGVICENDFDFYRIKLPLKSVSSKRREKFLAEELSKLHPYRLENCFFDSKVKLSKKGLYAEVAVINRFFAVRNPYKSFQLEKIKGKWFKRKVLKKNMYLVIPIFGLLLMMLSNPFLKKGNTKNSSDTLQNYAPEEKPVFTGNEIDFKKLDTLLQIIEENNGGIKNFNWAINGLELKVSIETENIFPEIILDKYKDLQFSNLTMNENKPGFSFSYRELKLKYEPENNMQDIKSRGKIREIINLYKGEIISESINPFEINFKLHSASFELFNSLYETAFGVSGIFLVRNEGDCISVSIKFDNSIKSSKEILEIIGKHKKSFFKASGKKIEPPKAVKIIDEEKKKEVKNPLGKVFHSDGSITYFYKNESGKLEFIKEEN